ncbi:MAG: glycosyltransferase [Betaproteobacteria bacterium]
MTQTLPAVSVLLPVYNGGAFFAKAVESILAQTFADFELLIVDDGSTDRSGAIAEDFSRRDARVHVTRRENRGLVATLNELVGTARGALLARMDADDIALPERLQRQVDYLREHGDVVCVGAGQILIDERDRKITQIHAPVDDARIQDLALHGAGSICHPTAMIRADAIRATDGYRKAYYPAEDLDLWLRLGELGKLGNIAEPLLLYRVHSGSISGQAAQTRQRDAARRACVDAWERRGLVGMDFRDSAGWRGGDDPTARLRYLIQCGWMAFNAGFGETAVAYAFKSIRQAPTSREAWQLLGISTFKRAGPPR